MRCNAAVCESMVGATLDLYNHVLAALPPTPSRFHYLFNPRDLGRVLEGLLLSTPARCGTPAALVRLWRNECLRVFHDRMISDEDKQARLSLILRHITALFLQGCPCVHCFPDPWKTRSMCCD